MKKIAGSIVMACLGGLIAVGLLNIFSKPEQVTIIEQIKERTPARFSANPPNTETLNFTYAAERTVNAVVHVNTEAQVSASQNPLFDFFHYEQSPHVQRGSGSGVIVSSDGYIVTNNHVIEGADRIVISLNNNKNYPAEIIGTDPATDIALIKIEAEDLPTMQFGDSDDLKIGEWVLAVGNPFDLTSTVTAGIVSAKARNINLLRGDMEREIFPIESFIQTDAAVNPGNSGGALVNTRGELVGINTAIASQTGSYSGYSFAVPASIVSKVAADLKEYGVVQRAFIGVRITEVNEQLAQEVGLKEVEGVYVSDLVPSGAAADAGIEAGDVILAVGNTTIRTVPELQEQVSRYRPGDEVSVSVWRNGRIERRGVILRNKDGNTDLKEAAESTNMALLGAAFRELSENELLDLGIRNGVQVTDLTSGKLSESGVKDGFIIIKVDGQLISDTDNLIETLKRKTGGVLIEGIYPNGKKAYYGFGL